MKSANGTTGNGDEHHREDGSLLVFRAESIPDFRQIRTLYIEHYKNTYGHEQQGYSEHWIYLSDYLVYRKDGGKSIIKKDDDDPEYRIHPVRSHSCKEFGGTAHKHGTYQHHQHQSEDAHYRLCL